MSPSKVASTLAVALVAASATGTLRAQEARATRSPQAAPDTATLPALTFGLSGGFASHSPLRPPGATDGLGYVAQAQVELRTPLRALHLRGEGMFARWANGERVSALTAGLVARPAARWRLLPYAVGGGGVYFPDGAGAAPGWTLGAGLDVPLGRRALFLESRMHALDVGPGGPGVRAGQRGRYVFAPLAFGIRF